MELVVVEGLANAVDTWLVCSYIRGACSMCSFQPFLKHGLNDLHPKPFCR